MLVSNHAGERFDAHLCTFTGDVTESAGGHKAVVELAQALVVGQVRHAGQLELHRLEVLFPRNGRVDVGTFENDGVGKGA